MSAYFVACWPCASAALQSGPSSSVQGDRMEQGQRSKLARGEPIRWVDRPSVDHCPDATPHPRPQLCPRDLAFAPAQNGIVLAAASDDGSVYVYEGAVRAGSSGSGSNSGRGVGAGAAAGLVLSWTLLSRIQVRLGKQAGGQAGRQLGGRADRRADR